MPDLNSKAAFSINKRSGEGKRADPDGRKQKEKG